MQNELTVSLVQYNIVWEDVDANIHKITKLFNQISYETDLVILPEMFSTGFTMQPEPVAELMTGKTVNWMRQTALDTKKAITGSLVIKEKDRYYNRLIFATPDGKLYHYDKRHLFTHGGENEHYTPGTQRLIINYLGWRICPLICYDLRFPVWSSNRNDYDLLIYVANWPKKRHDVWELLPLARAIENQSYVAAVNRIGEDKNAVPHAGTSRLIGCRGEVIEQASSDSEEVITTSFDFNTLHEFRKKFDFIADADAFGIFV